MIKWIKKLFAQEKVETDYNGLPLVKDFFPMPKVKPCKIENCTVINNSTLDGLELALKHCTKYEDRMFLQFLIKVEKRSNRGGIYLGAS
jgi:hypothetical protein